MRPILTAMEVGAVNSWLATYTVAQRSKRWRRLVLFLHENPVWAQLSVFGGWWLICIIVFASIVWSRPKNPVWGLLCAFLLEFLILLLLVWLNRLTPKNVLSSDKRWRLSANALAENLGGSQKARNNLRLAREDTENADKLTELILYTLLIGALINASIGNGFIDALGVGDISKAWKQSYIGTLSIFLIPPATFARVLLVLGPRNWIKQLERRLE